MAQCRFVAPSGEEGCYYWCGQQEGHWGDHADAYGHKHKKWTPRHRCPECGDGTHYCEPQEKRFLEAEALAKSAQSDL